MTSFGFEMPSYRLGKSIMVEVLDDVVRLACDVICFEVLDKGCDKVQGTR